MMIITNAKFFYKNQFMEKDLFIDKERILDIRQSQKHDLRMATEVIEARGLLILPGLIDVHVHLRDPGQTYKEDFTSGTRAALAGGITTVIDMPNNLKPTISLDRLKEKEKLAQEKALCDVRFHFGCTNNNFEEIKKTNPNSLKLYMFKTTQAQDLCISDEKIIERHMQNYSKKIVVHAEENDVERVCNIAQKCKRKIHIAHTPTRKQIEITRKTRNTNEVVPHHLFLSTKDEKDLGKLSNVHPHLRTEQERKDLWHKLDDIDCIATDHAPHTLEEKGAGAAGFPGLETSLSLMLDAYNKRLMNINWVVSRMSENPAKIFNLPHIGRIERGYYANLAFIDLKKEWVVKGNELETKCKWTPFEGKLLKGKNIRTMYKGKIVYENGEIIDAF